ncbi:MAG: shikimate dehydrogenase [Sideroxydans sp. RIFOXYD2_FULL_59_7]|nr:MAG: shikimate dehydrogenase [Sideroxydans sp. RIFOXYD2_FULL_59_7]
MTDRYAVIGNPISHSKSPLIHRMFAEQTGQDISYEAIEAPLDGFAATIERLRREGYKGCNVTVPFKEQAYRLAGSFGSEVMVAHAANTLELKNDRIEAHNTDGIGLLRDIEQNLQVSLRDKQILLMGAGGAAKGVATQLASLLLHKSPSTSLVIANRTVEKAHELARACNATRVSGQSYEELADQQFDIIINATSAGLTGDAIPLPDSIFAPDALAYDMMYGRETPFMAFARAHGARVADGLGMLVEQAAEAFHIWRGVRPDTRAVLDKLRA